MNYDLNNSSIVPYSITKEKLLDTFLDFLGSDEYSPVDVAYQVKVLEIKKLLYPVRCFNVSFEACWEATSFWEHTDVHTEYETKILYFDHEGKQHKRPGYDKRNVNGFWRNATDGGPGTEPWKPVSTIVPIEKKETVIDHIERTGGEIGPRQSFQQILSHHHGSAPFGDWIKSFYNSNNRVRYRADLVSDCEFLDLLGTEKNAMIIAKNNISKIAQELCRACIPGDRFEDLSYSVYNEDYSIEIVLFPLYHITYMYQNRAFAVWASGTALSNFFYQTKPQDNLLYEESVHFNEYLKNAKDKRLYAAIVGGFCLICSLALLFSGFTPLTIVLLIVFSIFTVSAFWLFYIRYNRVENMISTSKNRKNNLNQKRIEITNIVKARNMSDKEKEHAIQEILRRQ